MLDATLFSGIDSLLAHYAPLTPYGRAVRDERRVMTEPREMEASYDATERAMALLDGLGQVESDRISWYLRRMPRIPLEPKDPYETIELFQLKKFMANWKGLCALAGAGAEGFGLEFRLGPFSDELARGGSDPETFFVADCYDGELGAVRELVREIDLEIAKERARSDSVVASIAGVAFGGREFLLVSHDVGRALSESEARCAVEPYDGKLCVVRPHQGAETLVLLQRRAELADRERSIEDSVVARLSAMAREAMGEFALAVGRVTEFDLALARARMTRELGLTRPVLLAGDAPRLVVKGGRHLATEERCAATGMRYEPLDAEFAESVVMLSGSNMGGKTVSLKTVTFLQMAAQMGFHVPAARLETGTYDDLLYVGERAEHPSEGLSGFGFEIRTFIEARERLKGRAFVVFDEFARTTNSREAEAIISAVLEELVTLRSSRAFFATHFRGVARIAGVAYVRMLGLDHACAAEALSCAESPSELGTRLAEINSHMRYSIVPDSGGDAASDAIAVAAMLGLDPALAARAECYYYDECGRQAARESGGATASPDTQDDRRQS